MHPIKPRRLRRGDTVAVVSPSWGGPSVFPHIYDEGIRALRKMFELRVKEYPTARMAARDLYMNPRARANDLNAAFEDEEVRAIITTIGGSDSVRILPYIDRDVAIAYPKILLGFSDTVTLLTHYHLGGLVTFHGPSVMAGFSQAAQSLKAFQEHITTLLFEAPTQYQYRPFAEWYDRYPDWADAANTGMIGAPRPHDSWQWLQGSSPAQGRLFGGCIEVLEFLKGTSFWPAPSFWDGRLLFLETSEDKPTPNQVHWMLRNYGMQGIFNRIAGLLIGRARDYTNEEKHQLDAITVAVVADEFGRRDLPIVSNMDFGHTNPQWILPVGIRAEIDPISRTFQLLEASLT